METNNKTVEQVCEEMKEVTGTRRFIDSHYCNHCGDQIDGEGSALDVYSDRILAAHKRDIVAYELELDRWFHQGHKDRAKIKSLRTKNEKLRKLVKELADALNAINAKIEFDPYIGGKWNSLHMCSLVDRARKMIGGVK